MTQRDPSGHLCVCACAFLPYLCVCISSLFVQLSPVQYSACRSCLLRLLGLSFLSAHPGGPLCPEILCCGSSELGKPCGSPCLFPSSWRSLVCSLSCVLSKSSCCTYIWTVFLVTQRWRVNLVLAGTESLVTQILDVSKKKKLLN